MELRASIIAQWVMGREPGLHDQRADNTSTELKGPMKLSDNSPSHTAQISPPLLVVFRLCSDSFWTYLYIFVMKWRANIWVEFSISGISTTIEIFVRVIYHILVSGKAVNQPCASIQPLPCDRANYVMRHGELRHAARRLVSYQDFSSNYEELRACSQHCVSIKFPSS